jgi:hypothetical protein
MTLENIDPNCIPLMNCTFYQMYSAWFLKYIILRRLSQVVFEYRVVNKLSLCFGREDPTLPDLSNRDALDETVKK